MFYRINLSAISKRRQTRLGVVAVLLLITQLGLLIAYTPIAQAANPVIKIEKDKGETGSQLLVRGSGYDPDKLISIEIIQKNKPNTYPDELVYRIGLVNSDAKGEFTWEGFVPVSYVTVDYLSAEQPAQINPFDGPINIEATRYDYDTQVLGGAQIRYGTPEQKAKATFTVTANTGKGPKIFNGTGSLDAELFLEKLWNPLDLPVAALKANPNRGYIWGPRPRYATYEPYVEGSQNGYRPVIYFDKSRMENTVVKQPAYLTNGLLVTEMVRGEMQLGDTSFSKGQPSDVFVAGDLGSNVGPRFNTFQPLLTVAPYPDGSIINQQLKDGKVQLNPAAYDSFGVKAGNQIKETKHGVASVFWDYLNQKGTVATLSGTPPIYSYGKSDNLFNPTFYATGYPITEAYWAEVTVAGQVKPVLVQLFERRVLTYTPSNPPAYQVEMGNVGLQYFSWRYKR